MRQKINKDIKDSNSDPEQVNSINIYRGLHFKYTKYTFYTLNTQNIDWPLLIPIFRIKLHSCSLSLFFFLFLPLFHSFFSFLLSKKEKKKKSTCRPLDPGQQCLSHCLNSFLPFPPSLPPSPPSSLPSFLPPFLKN